MNQELRTSRTIPNKPGNVKSNKKAKNGKDKGSERRMSLF
jgi:hypothetical protein